jgi:hypothetical protein
MLVCISWTRRFVIKFSPPDLVCRSKQRRRGHLYNIANNRNQAREHIEQHLGDRLWGLVDSFLVNPKSPVSTQESAQKSSKLLPHSGTQASTVKHQMLELVTPNESLRIRIGNNQLKPQLISFRILVSDPDPRSFSDRDPHHIGVKTCKFLDLLPEHRQGTIASCHERAQLRIKREFDPINTCCCTKDTHPPNRGKNLTTDERLGVCVLAAHQKRPRIQRGDDPDPVELVK